MDRLVHQSGRDRPKAERSAGTGSGQNEWNRQRGDTGDTGDRLWAQAQRMVESVMRDAPDTGRGISTERSKK